MGSRRSVLGGTAVLIWVGTLVLHAATGIGWWAALPALAAAVLAALALPALPRAQARGAGPGRRGRARLSKGPARAGQAFPEPAGRVFPEPAGPALPEPGGRALPEPGGLPPDLWEAQAVAGGPVFRSDVPGSFLAWAVDEAEAVGNGSGARRRPLLEYADDPLTPVAAETLTDGLERLFLRLGPPPGATRGPDRTAPTPRGDDR
ncbi:hypothetical protein ACFWP2_19050 [Kitasatospora sp. NPDC058444]|uniref:hypothetical protein n=1 Tax=Kitasatospora sp. NPDC058444 TaxID=3346504 RepID=UPI003650221E